MNSEQWKQELNEVSLSEAQKMKMKEYVTSMSKPTRHWQYKFVAPAFIIVAMLCVILWQLPMKETTLINNVTSNEVFNPDEVYDEYALAYFAYLEKVGKYNQAAFVLLFLNALGVVLIILRTTRWQHTWLNRVRSMIHSLRFVLWFLAPFFIMLILTVLGVYELPILFYKWFLIGLVLLLETLLLLYLARNCKATISCPHCDYTYTKKERRKQALTFKLQTYCPSCNEQVFNTKRFKQVSGLLSILFGAVWMLVINFGVSFVATILIIIIYCAFLFIYIFPLFIDLTDKEQLPW